VSDALCFVTLDDWQSYVESKANATILHHRCWIELLMAQYGWQARIPALRGKDGEIQAAVPFLAVRRPWGTKKLVSLPFSDAVPPLCAAEDVLRLMEALRETGKLREYPKVVIRSGQPLGTAPSESHWYQHSIATHLPVEELWRTFSHASRRNYQRATAAKLAFELRRDAAAVRLFYRLHVLTRRKHGVPVQPWGFFVRLYEKIIAANLGFVGVVSKEGQPIAAAVLLHYQETLIYKYGASDPLALEDRPNDFLFYHAIDSAHRLGCSRLDLGISAKQDDGLCQFKRKWGAQETEMHHCYFAGRPGLSAVKSRTFNFASAVIRRSPTAVCRVLGELFYRYSS